MKYLYQFLKFDFDAFSKGKQFICTGVQPWKDHDTGKVIGTKVTAVIFQDHTTYSLSAGSEQGSNVFEKLVFKVNKEIEVPVNKEIVPVHAVATVYGEYRNQLSVTADDIQVVNK